MKRNLYIQMAMVAAALIVAGCSSDDDAAETAPELRAISFTGGVNTEEQQTSRAEDEGLEEYSHQFIVFGYKNGVSESVMNGYTVNWIETSAGTTTSNTHDWEYVGQGSHKDHPQVIKYWDSTATNYSFFGYVPARTDTTTSPRYYKTNITYPTTSSSIHQIQFEGLSYCAEYKGKYTYLVGHDDKGKPIYADTLDKTDMPLVSRMCRITDKTKMGGPVRLEFTPPYTRVKIGFQRIANVESSPIRAISFKPQDKNKKVPNHATVTCNYNIANGNTSVALSSIQYFDSGLVFDALSKTENDTIKGIMDEANKIYYADPYYMLFPTTDTPGDFVLQANIGSGLQECVVPAAYMKWEMGYEYTYIFKITKAGLNLINVIKVGIKPWESIGREETKFHNW